MKLTEAIAPWEPEWDQLDHSEDDDMLDDEDWPGGTCGRWSNGRLTGSCRLAGTEECDFECPHRDSLYGTPLGLSTLESRRVKLTKAQSERRQFNRWFSETMADADGRHDHFPRWLKADMWLAWQAGRSALSNPEMTNG